MQMNLKSKFLFPAICALTAIALLGCGRKKNQETELPSLQFKVDHKLLSEAIQLDSGLTISFPKDWSTVPEAAFEQMRQSAAIDTTLPFRINLREVRQSTTGALVAVSLITDHRNVFADLDSSYDRKLEALFGGEKLDKTSFQLNGLPTLQYRLIGPDLVAFRIICAVTDKYFLTDFIIPRSVYDQEVRKIESCIGSISRL